MTAERAAGVAPKDVNIEGDLRGQSRECGPTKQLRIIAALRAALNAAVKQRKIPWNPCDGVEPYLDPETGEERIGALLGVERPIIQIGGKLRESRAKTKMGQRRVFLDHETAELLREHRKAQLRLRLRAGNAWQDNDLVFCQDDGRPWNPDHVSKRSKKLAALAGVPVICLHEGGRHTGNSLPDAGVDQELRMREVRHADKTVNDCYTHPLEQAHLAAAEQAAALVRKARGQAR